MIRQMNSRGKHQGQVHKPPHFDIITSGDYRLKLTTTSTVVYTKNVVAYNAVLKNLKSNQAAYHTPYSARSTRRPNQMIS